MQCPKCQSQSSKVIDSRPAEEGQSLRRRRECLECGFRFNPHERIEQAPLLVVKRDGTREEFNRDKLMRGIVRSVEKRLIAVEQMHELVKQVVESLRDDVDQEIETSRIGEYVMPLLMELDEVAYIRFASVYREFQSRESFMKELESMAGKHGSQIEEGQDQDEPNH